MYNIKKTDEITRWFSCNMGNISVFYCRKKYRLAW